LFHCVDEGVALVTGPLSHNAPFASASAGLLMGVHQIVMTRFDAARALELIERYRVDWMYAVPTMMLRIWRLPEAERRARDLSSLRTVFHMAAPCPPWLKQAWIDWLGPDRIWELYGGTEAQALTVINGHEWLAHRGSVGRPAVGEIRVLAADGQPCPPDEVGEVWLRRVRAHRLPTATSGPRRRPATDGSRSATWAGWTPRATSISPTATPT
jgi:bile acid-coenzyme A ligase